MKLNLRSVLQLVGLLAMLACVPFSWAQEEQSSGISGYDELEKGKSRFRETWVHPAAGGQVRVRKDRGLYRA